MAATQIRGAEIQLFFFFLVLRYHTHPLRLHNTEEKKHLLQSWEISFGRCPYSIFGRLWTVACICIVLQMGFGLFFCLLDPL